MRGDLFGRQQGERYTIQCLELRGPLRFQNTEEIVKVLRRAPGITPSEVSLIHDDDVSTVFYGTYIRPYDKKTGQLMLSKQTKEDIRLLKELVDERGVHYFLEAKLVPVPTPDIGPPEWDLAGADGKYSLQVAVFYNTPGFDQRKGAALEYVKDLRSRGYQAYYYHGERASMVTVGLFGDDAIVQREDGPHYNDEVKALQTKEETFLYNLENGRKKYRIEDGQRIPVPSLLVHVPVRQSFLR